MIYLRCEDCGYENEFEDEDEARDCNWWKDNDGEWYCGDCHNECGFCEDEFPQARTRWCPTEERYICESCRERHGYNICEQCQGAMSEEDTITVIYQPDGRQMKICRTCYSRLCHDHMISVEGSQRYPIYSPDRIINGHTLQRQFNPQAWNAINQCPDCENNGNVKCPKCLREMAKLIEEEETNLWVYDTRAMSYHHQDHIHFKETKLRKKHEHPYLYYGCELEYLFNSGVDINTISKEFIQATGGLFVAEFDRSVSERGNGIEFISRPLSYPMWMSEQVYQLLQAGQEVLKKYKAYMPQPDTCGLHIHMSLQFFEKNTTKKVKEIKADIDWIFQVFQSEIEKISRRKYTRYCASKAFRASQLLENNKFSYGFNLKPAKIVIEKGAITVSQGSGDTHHDAIVQTPKTIEVRTFRSTTEPNELLATIEFCRAIAHAARNKKLTTKDTLGDILYCKDSKYLQDLVEKTKVDTTKNFAKQLEVKL